MVVGMKGGLLDLKPKVMVRENHVCDQLLGLSDTCDPALWRELIWPHSARDMPILLTYALQLCLSTRLEEIRIQ